MATHQHFLPTCQKLSITFLQPCLIVLLFVSLSLQTEAQQSNLVNNTYKPIVNPPFTNLSTTTSGFSNVAGLTDSDTTNLSTWSYLLNAITNPSEQGYVEVRDNVATGVELYPAGSYAGFSISTSGIQVGTTTNITITTYNSSATVLETYTTNLSNLVNIGGGTQRVGFITSLPYNRIRITFEVSGVLGLGSISVRYAEVARFVAGPSLDCNTNTLMNLPVYPVTVNSRINSTANLAGLLGGISNLNAIISSSSSDFAIINPSVGVLNDSVTVGVKDQVTDYTNPTFAGFDIETATLASLNIGAGGNISIRAYLNGVLVDEAYSHNLVVCADLISSNRRTIGFVPSATFDSVTLTLKSGTILGVSLGATRIYGTVFKKFCAGAPLACNTNTAMNLPAYPVTAGTSVSGVVGTMIGGISNIDNVISASTSDFATINPSVGVLGNSITLAVKDQVTDYAYPSFVGFDISAASLANLSLAGNIALAAYKDGVLVGTATGNALLAGASVLTGSSRQIIGFVPSGDVDEVRLTLYSGLIGGVTLGVTDIYSAVFRRFCEGAIIPCNTLSTLDQSQYPVYISAIHTGVTGGVLAVNNNIQDAANVIDNDASTYATATVLAGALNRVSLSVRKELSDFSVGTFAGFEIGNTSTLLNAALLSDISISLYKDGHATPIQTAFGSTQLVAVSSSLLGAGSSRMVVGIVATADYDEVVISFNNTVAASTGITRIYSFYAQRFCEGAINCNGTYWLNTGPPPTGYPVIINGLRTGLSGVACANVSGYELGNTQNVISPSTTDYATVKMGVNALCPVSISVEDVLTTYPSGTIAGFAIRNLGSLVELDLFNSITIQTWHNGALQQSATGGTLLKLELLNSPILGGGSGTYNVGFKTTLPFDEVRIIFGGLLNVDPLNEIRVYGAYVDTRGVTLSDGTQTLTCLLPSVTPTNPAPICEGNTVLLTAEPSGATSYQWYKDDMAITDANNQTYSASESGSYTVIVDETGYSGVASNAVTVTINPIPPTPTISANGTTTFCMNAAVTLSSSASSGNQWYRDGGSIGGATSQDYMATQSGSYTVVATVDGCSSLASDPTVVTVNDCVPVAVDDIESTDEDTALNGDVSLNDTPSGDGTNTWSLVGANGGAAHGTVSMNADGTFTYIPAANYFGVDEFSYQVCDPGNDCAAATVSITVNSINDAPVAGDATAGSQSNPDGTTSATVSAGLFSGADVDGTIQNLTITAFPTNATSITINGTSYTSGSFPAAGVTVPTNAAGQPTQPILIDPVDGDISVVISYTVTDDQGAVSANSGSVTLPFVTPPDLAPSITVAPSIMHGITTFYLTIQVTALNSVASNGTITVIIPKDSRVSFTYNPSLTSVGFSPVNNAVWSYDGSNAFFHVFTSNTVILANGWSVFGVEASFNPLNAKGNYTVTSSISSGSGGENKTSNNSDAEIVNYFPGN